MFIETSALDSRGRLYHATLGNGFGYDLTVDAWRDIPGKIF